MHSQFNSARLVAARQGDYSARAELLQTYESYLLLIARVQINRRLRGRVAPSDIVQSVFLRASERFSEFRGSTEREFAGWLRRILAAQLVSIARRHLAKRRDVRLERAWDAAVDQSSIDIANCLARDDSPSQHAVQREQAVILAQALDQLPEHYREVIVLRHLEGMTFPEIAERLRRTIPSVKNVWVRAVSRLRSCIMESDL